MTIRISIKTTILHKKGGANHIVKMRTAFQSAIGSKELVKEYMDSVSPQNLKNNY